mgnify:CR=1 FL=1
MFSIAVNTNDAVFSPLAMYQSCTSPADPIAVNLRRLMAREGLTLLDVVQRTGLDHRTIKAMLAGRQRPQPRTLHRLARGLGVDADELFQNPALLARRQFDRQTNPVVDEVTAQHPQLFEGWSPGDFAELASRFGTGGALTPEGAVEAVQKMNHKREVQQQVALLMETNYAELVSRFVQLLYEQVRVDTDL